jgi:DNA-directed RNA polymerase subunit M/transcription elongation factor TFIIS
MVVKITCPICGGEVLLEGEEKAKDDTVTKCYLCEPCDHTFKVDCSGNIIEEP